MGHVTIDLVTTSRDGSVNLILVEQGPWQEAYFLEHLRRVQNRIYDVVDAALDGLLTNQFPQIHGNNVSIRVDFYETPQQQSEQLVETIAQHVAADVKVAEAIRTKGHVSRITFLHSWHTL
ncbi:MAG: hypothetical protein EXS13_03370 [Planctomycetes bacterium]|nr:hypothetical protein [Planctomycetota bacterium]